MNYDAWKPAYVTITKEKSMNLKKMTLEIMMFAMALIFIMPVWLVIVNSFKPLGEILGNTAGVPKSLYLDNFLYVLQKMNYLHIFWNTLIITVGAIIITVTFSAMCGYMLCRTNDFKSGLVLALLMSSMIIPFQTIMIPLAKIAKILHLVNSIPGLIVILVPLYAPFAVFMYHGFIKSIPREIEESATIDGCSPFGVFFRIILPNLKPVTSSIIVLYTMWLWNDFLLPVMMLQSADKKTITITIYSFFSSVSMRWDYALAALTLSAAPILLFFIFMQKYIIKGVTAGAVKG